MLATRYKVLAPDSIKKEYSAAGFLKLVAEAPHLIKSSRYVIAPVGSGQRGKFVVELENFKY